MLTCSHLTLLVYVIFVPSFFLRKKGGREGPGLSQEVQYRKDVSTVFFARWHSVLRLLTYIISLCTYYSTRYFLVTPWR